jgi:release factor glutamine methyltransferase
MPSGIKRAFFGDYVFSVDENVYEPAEDSFFFAENLDVKVGERVLDMGTGSGILGVIATGKASEVVAVDVNPCAVRCAKANAMVNNARSKMAFVESDLFASLNEETRFDVILFNAPYLPIEDETDGSLVSVAWNGGETGRNVIDRFIGEVSDYLSPDGRVFLMQSNLAGVDDTVEKFTLHGMSARILAQMKLPLFETLFLIEARFAK